MAREKIRFDGIKSDGSYGSVYLGCVNGALDFHDADIHTKVINQYVHQHTATATTLTSPTVGDGTEYTIDIADATGFADDDYIHIDTTSTETTHPRILSATPALPTTGPVTLTLDRRLDNAHSIGDAVTKVITNMASQIGTLASPKAYTVGPEDGSSVWHITRILFEMQLNSAGDLGLFGNLSPLTNGVVLRSYIGGQYYTLTNWKQNSDIKVDMYDLEFDARSGGGGTHGVSGRGTFTRTGAILRLDGAAGDYLEVLIQDDLLTTPIISFTMKAQGHIEE